MRTDAVVCTPTLTRDLRPGMPVLLPNGAVRRVASVRPYLYRDGTRVMGMTNKPLSIVEWMSTPADIGSWGDGNSTTDDETWSVLD